MGPMRASPLSPTVVSNAYKSFLADVRTWDGGIHTFLLDRQCDPDVIERIMAYEKKA